MLQFKDIDNGKAFDWGNTSADYGKYRDIYPASFYNRLASIGFAAPGQKVLDIGTGTGVIARHIYNDSLQIAGIDIEENQILQARKLAEMEGKQIDFYARPAEETGMPDNMFDSVIAAQCYIYFDIPRLLKELNRILKPGGRFYISWFCWLPKESEIAQKSEDLILKYNPDWKGAGFERDFEITFPTEAHGFTSENQVRYIEDIPFTKEAWAGRVRASRGVGAVLNNKQLADFEKEHRAALESFPDNVLNIPHLVLINSYKRTLD